jgi:peptide/nickel transport system permease protein
MAEPASGGLLAENTVQRRVKEMYARNTALKKAARSISKSPTGLAGLVLVIALLFVTAAAPLIAPYKPAETNSKISLRPPVWLKGGVKGYVLGTDYLGRDVFSRIVYGARISLLVGVCAVAVAGAIGLCVGLVSGYFGKAVDALIMRFVDGFRSIPTILMNLVIMMIAGPGVGTVIFSLGVTTWTHYARIVRGEVLSVRQREYVLSARAAGAGNARIIFTDIMPNIMSAFIVSCTNSIASAIITESSLSFLGLGIAPPSVTWGSILSDGRSYVATAWWISAFPGIAICVAVLGIMFLGDWLRDFLDPRINANA